MPQRGMLAAAVPRQPMDPTERKRRPNAAWQAYVAAEAAELGGWHPTALCDGFRSDGRPLHWETYSHPDGREVDVFGGGHCSDPELQALLKARATARAARGAREEKLRPWHQRAMDRLQRALLRAVLRVLRAVQRALVGRNPG